jgi:hypothetical protein
MSPLILSLCVLAQAGAKAAANPPGPPVPTYRPAVGDKAFLFPQGGPIDIMSVPIVQPVDATFIQFFEALDADPPKEYLANTLVETRQAAYTLAGTSVEVLAVKQDVTSGLRYAVLIKLAEGPMKGTNALTSFDLISKSLPTVRGMSFRRYMDMKVTAEKQRTARQVMSARNAAAIKRDQERVQAAIEAEQYRRAVQAKQQAELIRQNTPDYVSVTRDSSGRMTSIYTHMPSGFSSFRDSSGFSSTTQTFTRP